MSAFSIGVDLGGTNLRVAAMREDGLFVETLSLETRRAQGRDAVIADLCDAVSTMEQRHSRHAECIGVGIGMPGPLELPAGILRRPPNLPGWDGFDVRSAIEQRLERPIHLNSDANMAALAELRLGAGKTYATDSLCMLTLGTGVGNGIILNGHIWHGMNGMAGEAGHMTVAPDGAPCGCGSHGCLEQYASATAIRRMAAERAALPGERNGGLAECLRKMPDFGSHDVARWAEAGICGAQAVFDEVGRCLGLALAALINTLNLPLYVIGGGSAAAWPVFERAMMAELRERSYVYRATAPGLRGGASAGSGATQVVPAALGSGSGLQGAALLPFVESNYALQLEDQV
jgi:glucokinase